MPSGSELADFSVVRPDTPLAAAQARHQRARRRRSSRRFPAALGVDVRHVDGHAADRRRRRVAAASAIPTGRVAELKAALIETGKRRQGRGPGRAADPRRRRARQPAQGRRTARARVACVASPSASCGRVRPCPATVDLADAGGGAGTWDVTVDPVGAAAGASIVVAPTVVVPGGLDLIGTVDGRRDRRRSDGFVRLTRGADIRRIPFWLRVGRPGLAAAVAIPLKTPGRPRRRHAGQAVARLPLPLPGGPARRRSSPPCSPGPSRCSGSR